MPRAASLVGAGQAADMLIREIQRMPSLNMKVVGLVDDKPELANMSMQGSPVLGKVDDVPSLVADHAVTQIIVSLPSATAGELADYLPDLQTGRGAGQDPAEPRRPRLRDHQSR